MKNLKSLFAVFTFGLALVIGCSPGSDYYTWDGDRDDMIDENEFAEGFENDGLFDDWDYDRDGLINEDEWDEGIGRDYEGLEDDFESWDADQDGYVDEYETRDGVFELWDEDRSGYIDEREWGEWNDA